MNKKILTFVGITFLFLGVGINPAFAEESTEPESNLIEVTIRICKPCNIEEYNLMLTQEQVEKLDNEFDNFKVKLDNAISKRDTIEIYNDMIISLDKLGLFLDYMSLNEAQQLVIGRNHLVFGNVLPSKLFDNSNFFCSISGRASDSDCLLINLPIHIGGIIYFGSYTEFHPISGDIINYPTGDHSVGWIKTNGILGNKEWNDSFYGGIFNLLINIVGLEWWIYGHVGVVGFTGIAISRLYETSFIGFAPWVKIKNV